MPSYVIAGSSRGLGLEFVLQTSNTPSNVVFALVRNPDRAERLQHLARERPNIHVIHADVTNPKALQDAATTVSKVTGGKLDVLIYNANMYDAATAGVTASRLPADREGIQNVFEMTLFSSLYAPAWTTNAFLPLIERGEGKKIVHISSAMADSDFIRQTGIEHSLAYSVGKAGMNVLAAKYAAELAAKGIKALSISPGWVDTHEGPKPEQELALEKHLLKRFQALWPDVKGRLTKEDSAAKVLKIIDTLDLELSGAFISQNGNKAWFP